MKTFHVMAMALLLLAASQTAFAFSETENRSEILRVFEERVRSMEELGRMPIIDVEFHCGPKIDLESLTRKMDENKIALTWLGWSGNHELDGDGNSLQAHKKYPSYFVPTIIHGDGPLWHGHHPALLPEIEKDAQSGNFFAMGEFEARHYASDTNNRNIYHPMTNEDFQQIFKISESYGLPFMIHHEAENEMLPEMEAMLQKYPKATVIWCHIGRNRNYIGWSRWIGTRTVRDFLTRYPNLHFDLIQNDPWDLSGGKFRQAVLYDVKSDTATLNPEWKQLLIDFPDRFVIGSDVNHGRWVRYEKVFETFRRIVLASLPQDVAEKIAYKNAWRLMTGKEWNAQKK